MLVSPHPVRAWDGLCLRLREQRFGTGALFGCGPAELPGSEEYEHTSPVRDSRDES